MCTVLFWFPVLTHFNDFFLALGHLGRLGPISSGIPHRWEKYSLYRVYVSSSHNIMIEVSSRFFMVNFQVIKVDFLYNMLLGRL